MTRIIATVDRMHRIALPAEIRLRLGIGPGDKVGFVLDETGVRIEPVRRTLANLYGAVTALPGETADLEKEIDEAMSAGADRIARFG